MATDIRMKLESSDISGERVAALRELLPEVFSEGKIDFEKLHLVLGDKVETGRERYGFPGSRRAQARLN